MKLLLSGYVGNKSAVFPMQLLGLEVDPVLSVQFSNHKGYPVFEVYSIMGFCVTSTPKCLNNAHLHAQGEVLQGDQLHALIAGLEANAVLWQYTHALTGFIGSVSFGEAVVGTMQKLKAINPDLVLCMPVFVHV